MLGLRLVGCYWDGSRIRYRRTTIALWCVVTLELLTWTAIRVAGENDIPGSLFGYAVWVMYFIAATVAVVGASHALIEGFRRLTPSLDDVLSQRGHQTFDLWAARSYAAWKQVLAGVVGGVGAPIGTLVLQLSAASNHGTVNLLDPSYVVVAISGFFTGVSVYWVPSGLALCRLLAREGELVLYPLIPARTPGIEHFALLLTRAFLVCAALSAAFLVPFVFWTRGLAIDNDQVAPQFAVVRAILLGVTGVVTLAIGLIPHLLLSRAIRRTRWRTLSGLIDQLRPGARWRSSATQQRLEHHVEVVANSPASTLDSANLVQMIVGAAAVVTPFFTSLIFG